MKRLTHIDEKGEAQMVDVSDKPVQQREALAQGEIFMKDSTLELIEYNKISKGNVFASAKLAGVMAAKQTGTLIPLAHPLPMTHCELHFDVPDSRDRIVISASAKVAGRTGVEMEALTAVSMAALTIYDMCKGVDDTMVIRDVRVLSKSKK
jgi:cyclic pyranopterin phosphate synthase